MPTWLVILILVVLAAPHAGTAFTWWSAIVVSAWKGTSTFGAKIAPLWLGLMIGVVVASLLFIGLRYLPTIHWPDWPTPGPVEPGPNQPPVIVPTQEFRVLLVYESGASNDKYNDVLYSPVVREYLNRKCAKDSKGHPDWRLWDAKPASGELDVSKESAIWQSLWLATKAALPVELATPSLVVFSGTKGVVMPLPDDPVAALALLKKYGGE